MPNDPDQPSLPLSLGHRPGLSFDLKADLGYGIGKSKFHEPRVNGSEFPYMLDDEESQVDLSDEYSEEFLKKLSNKITTPYKSSDNLIGRSADNFSFANGNIRTGIGEAVAKGMVPFPNMYKNRVQAGGGVNSPKLVSPGQYNRTGTYRGWSKAPIPLDDVSYDQEDENLKKIRSIVRHVLKNNVLET
jgi:hypothetical protein